MYGNSHNLESQSKNQYDAKYYKPDKKKTRFSAKIVALFLFRSVLLILLIAFLIFIISRIINVKFNASSSSFKPKNDNSFATDNVSSSSSSIFIDSALITTSALLFLLHLLL